MIIPKQRARKIDKEIGCRVHPKEIKGLMKALCRHVLKHLVHDTHKIVFMSVRKIFAYIYKDENKLHFLDVSKSFFVDSVDKDFEWCNIKTLWIGILSNPLYVINTNKKSGRFSIRKWLDSNDQEKEQTFKACFRYFTNPLSYDIDVIVEFSLNRKGEVSEITKVYSIDTSKERDYYTKKGYDLVNERLAAQKINARIKEFNDEVNYLKYR